MVLKQIANNQVIQLIIIVYLVCMVLFLSMNIQTQIGQIKSHTLSENCKIVANKRLWIDEFREIAAKYGTDKGKAHGYHNMYGKILGPMKYENVSLLEIGLGCTMPYGPGRSIPVWREFLPKVKLSILEYDGDCAEKFRSKVEQLFIGDQSDFKVLKEVAKGGPYDIIIDDGGHQVIQQINSLIGLWPVLNSGGVYSIEDLYLYNTKSNYDPNISTFDWIQKLNFLLINNLPSWDLHQYIPPNITIPKELHTIYKTLFSIECYHRACVLIKK